MITKNLISMILALVLLFVLAGSAGAGEDPHLLWDIPYGIGADDLTARISEIGIDLQEIKNQSGNILRYDSKDNQKMSIAGMPVKSISFRDSKFYGITNNETSETPSFIYNDAIISFESLEKKNKLIDQEMLVFWLDYVVLPDFFRSYKVPFDALNRRLSKPDFIYYRSGYTDAAVEIDDIREANDAKFWYGDALELGGLPTFQHICAVWGNVVLTGHFSYSYSSGEVKITWQNTIRFSDQNVSLPMSTRKADIELDF